MSAAIRRWWKRFLAWIMDIRGVFWIQLFYLIVLFSLAIVFFAHKSWLPVPDSFGRVPVGVPWFGALGAVTISMSALRDNRHNWDPHYFYWHCTRPFIGAAVGIVSALIFIAGILSVGGSLSADKTPKIDQSLLYYVIAFVVGYREESFRELMKRMADLILKSEPLAGPPTLEAVLPDHGLVTGGFPVDLWGEDMGQVETVKFGGIEAKIDPSHSSGSRVHVTCPKADKPGAVIVTVLTRHGQSIGRPFTYEPPP